MSSNEEDSTEENAEDVPAGTESENSSETETGGDDADSEEPQATQETQEGQDDPLGEESGTAVYDQSPETSGYREVKIKCAATSCIFNRQGNCHASEIEIDMSAEKGQVPSATSCKTYTPAGVDE